jgi:predicted membrane-bound spermidine synthase
MDKRQKFLNWDPALFLLILSLIYASLLVLLGVDVFSSETITLSQIAAFVIHSLPGLLVALSAIIGYRRPLWGTFGYAGITILFWLVFRQGNDVIAHLVVLGIPIIFTILYGLRWFLVRKNCEDSDD